MRGERQLDEEMRSGNKCSDVAGASAHLPPLDLLSWLTLAVFVLMALVSLWHIFDTGNIFRVSPAYLGLLGWSFFFFATLNFARRWLQSCFLIFLLFFSFGLATGSYLEPISDQLDHLYRTHELCGNWEMMTQPGQGSWHHTRNSHGLWQYSMNSLFVCHPGHTERAEERQLLRLDILQGLYLGIAAVILFALARASGLPARWAFFALVTAFLFFGTSKFSFFRYYSFGPTFSSLCLYWLWIAYFFFNRSLWLVVVGSLVALALVPVLYVNHIQECVFLVFLVSFWLLLNTGKYLFSLQNNTIKTLFVVAVLFFFFVMPSTEVFRRSIIISPPPSKMAMGSNHVYSFYNLYMFPRLFDPRLRIMDTTGAVGLLAFFVSLLLVFGRWQASSFHNKCCIALLGTFPFLVISIPFYSSIWVANVTIHVYYRIFYGSVFWCAVASFLFVVEAWLLDRFAGRGVGNA